MRDWILFVEDIFHACVDIESYVKDLTYESFLDEVDYDCDRVTYPCLVNGIFLMIARINRMEYQQ